MCINKHWKDETETNKTTYVEERNRDKKRQEWEFNFFVLPIYSVAPTLCKSVMYLKNIFNLLI